MPGMHDSHEIPAHSGISCLLVLTTVPTTHSLYVIGRKGGGVVHHRCKVMTITRKFTGIFACPSSAGNHAGGISNNTGSPEIVNLAPRNVDLATRDFSNEFAIGGQELEGGKSCGELPCDPLEDVVANLFGIDRCSEEDDFERLL